MYENAVLVSLCLAPGATFHWLLSPEHRVVFNGSQCLVVDGPSDLEWQAYAVEEQR